MQDFQRRVVLAAASGAALTAAQGTAQGATEPVSGAEGAPIAAPVNAARQAQEPFTTRPPRTDHGTMPNLQGDSVLT